MLNKFEAYLQKSNKALIWIVSGALIFMILMIVVDVSGRYIFNSPLPASVEITEIIMPLVIYPALAYALAKRQHVSVSLVTDRLPPRARLAFEIFAYLMGLFFAVLITYWGWQEFWKSFVINEIKPAAILLPWWVAKLFVPFGGFFFALQFLLLLLQDLSSLSTRRNV